MGCSSSMPLISPRKAQPKIGGSRRSQAVHGPRQEALSLHQRRPRRQHRAVIGPRGAADVERFVAQRRQPHEVLLPNKEVTELGGSELHDKGINYPRLQKLGRSAKSKLKVQSRRDCIQDQRRFIFPAAMTHVLVAFDVNLQETDAGLATRRSRLSR